MENNKKLEELFASRNIDLDSFGDIEIISSEEVSWESIDRMVENMGVSPRVINSRGEIHLKGSGVKANAAPASFVGNLLNEFQCTIDALGASISGHTSAMGAIPSAIRTSTMINIVASPQPGSLRLNISPAQQGFDEVFPNGETLFGFDDLGRRPLADIAVEELINLLAKVDTQSPNNEDLMEELMDRGPRVTSTFKGLMKSLDEGNFDADLKWSEPKRDKKESTITHELARYAVSVIENARIETNERTFSGTLITSTASKKDKIRISLDNSGEDKIISLGKIDPIAMNQFHTYDKVIIKAEESIGHYVGGRETIRLMGLSIEATPRLDI